MLVEVRRMHYGRRAAFAAVHARSGCELRDDLESRRT